MEKNKGQLSEQVVSRGLDAIVSYDVGIFPCTCETFVQSFEKKGIVKRHCLNCHADSYSWDPGTFLEPTLLTRTPDGAFLQIFSQDEVSRAVAFGVGSCRVEV